jgi:hypothetical protein
MGFVTEVKFIKFLFAFASVVLAWQAGWGMSIERFHKREISEINKK